MSPDPLDELARRLFEAARDERPAVELVARVRSGAVHDEPASGARAAVRPLPVAGRRRRLQRWLAAAIVLGGSLLLARARWLEPEPGVHISAEARPLPPPAAAPAPPAAAAAPAAPFVPFQSAPAPREAVTQPPEAVPAPRRHERAPAPSFALPPSSTPATARAAAPPPAPAASLSAQLELLKQARSLLRSGDGAAALQLLDRYTNDLHGADLQDEAALLRMEALWSLDERGRATELARQFVSEHPDSPLAERAQRFIPVASSGPAAGSP